MIQILTSILRVTLNHKITRKYQNWKTKTGTEQNIRQTWATVLELDQEGKGHCSASWENLYLPLRVSTTQHPATVVAHKRNMRIDFSVSNKLTWNLKIIKSNINWYLGSFYMISALFHFSECLKYNWFKNILRI